MNFKKVIISAVLAVTATMSMLTVPASAASSNPNGFSFTVYKNAKRGDVNGDDWITYKDISKYSKIYAEIATKSKNFNKTELNKMFSKDPDFKSYYYNVLDIDKDGKLNYDKEFGVYTKYADNTYKKVSAFRDEWETYDVYKDSTSINVYFFEDESTKITVPRIDSADARIIVAAINGKVARNKKYDVNKDGSIDIFDVSTANSKATRWYTAYEKLRNDCAVK